MSRTAMVGVRLRPEVKQALELAAERDNRSMSSLVERIVTEWLRDNKLLEPRRFGYTQGTPL